MLTNEQIEYLFCFCASNGVPYYDVQVELVDHLANAIESKMLADPKLTFEKAVEKVHRNFGYRGFESLVIEKKNMVKKQHRRLFRKLFKQQFRWPKAMLFLVFFICLVTLFSMNIRLVNIITGATFLAGSIPAVYSYFLKKTTLKAGYEFLLVDISSLTSLWIFVPNLLNMQRIFTDKNILFLIPQLWIVPCMSIFLSIYIIGIITLFQTLSSVKTSLYKNYPLVFSTIN